MAYSATATLPRQSSVPQNLPSSSRQNSNRSISPVRRAGRRGAARSQSARRVASYGGKPKPRLLVDYSKKRADLKSPRAVGPLRRTQSLDDGFPHQFYLRNSAPDNNHNSAVDWHKLSNELDWEEESNRTASAVRTNNVQHHSSSSDLLRQSFLTKPLGMSHSHLQGQEFQFPKDITVSNHKSQATLTLYSSRRASLNLRSRSASPKRTPKRAQTTQSRPVTVRRPTVGGPPPFNHLGLADPTAPLGSSMDESMRLGDVFGMDKSLESNNNSSGQHHHNSNTTQREASSPTRSTDSDESDDHSTDALVQRLTQGAAPPKPILGRLYRSVSATMSAIQSAVTPQRLSTSTSELMDDLSSLSNDTASLSFRRTSSSPQKLKAVLSKGKKGNHLGGTLGLQPWDDDFNNSISSMSSYCESMDDDSYQQEQDRLGRRSSGQTNGTGVATDHARRRNNSLLVSDDETEAEKEDQDLLFLPPAPNKAASGRNLVRGRSAGTTNTPHPERTTSGRNLRSGSGNNPNNSQLTISKANIPRDNSASSLGSSSELLMGGSSRMNNSSRRSNDLRRKSDNSESMRFFALRKINSASNKLNGSTTSLDYNSDPNLMFGQEEDYLDEEEKKRQLRNQVVRSNSRKNYKRSQSFDDTKTPRNFTPSPPNSGNRRNNLKKQLSCERLDSEYERFSRKNQKEQLQKSHSSRSVSPTRRNAALLMRADSVPSPGKKDWGKRPVPNKSVSSPKLTSSRNQAPQQVVTTTWTRRSGQSKAASASQLVNPRRKVSQHVKTSSKSSRRPAPSKAVSASQLGAAPRRAALPPSTWSLDTEVGNDPATTTRGVEKQGSSRRGRGLEKQGLSHRGRLALPSPTRHLRSSSPLNIPKPTRKLPGRSRSVDDESGIANQNTGFRESLLLQASFVTGSRIRRLNNSFNNRDSNNNAFNSSFNMSFNNNTNNSNIFTSNMNYSSPNLNF